MTYILPLISLSLLFASKELSIDIKNSLMSPCCWAGTVYDMSHNPEMEDKIDELLKEGKTKTQILDFYVNIYGERILAIPIAKGFNLMAWFGPIIMAIISFLFILTYLRNSNKNSNKKNINNNSDQLFSEQIENELKEFD
tara:strand:- start:2756 stop:3175 length:420 start_codon:yes stop_codon:yes gene_type:complete